MNGKCAKRIRSAYREAFCSGADTTYKQLKAQYKTLPYHKRWKALVTLLGSPQSNWYGHVPGHSQRLKEHLDNNPRRQRRLRNNRKMAIYHKHYGIQPCKMSEMVLRGRRDARVDSLPQDFLAVRDMDYSEAEQRILSHHFEGGIPLTGGNP